MAEKLIVNGTAAALAAQGETTPAFTAANSTGAITAAEADAVADLEGYAVIKLNATTAGKVAVILTLLDNISSGVDLSTSAKRKKFRLQRDVEGFAQLIAAIPSQGV